MKERPILFSAPMVRALLAGTKTQTRRVLKRQFADGALPVQMPATDPIGGWVVNGDSGLWWCEAACNPDEAHRCPYGQPGDRLWVREAHSIGPGPGTHLEPGETAGALRWPHVTYLADGAVERRDMRWKGAFGRGRPSIHMPRWASRILLEVVAVRVERLQDISEVDAIAEGVHRLPLQDGPGAWRTGSVESGPWLHGRTPQDAYRLLWESINGPGSWEANPWVWVVEFKRAQGVER